MKVFLVFLCIFVFGATSDDTQNFNPQLIESVFASKCILNSHNSNAFIEFKEALINFKTCGNSAFTEPPPDPVENHEKFCTVLRTSGFYSCVEDLMGSLTPCLDENEKYIPHLFLHAVNATYSGLCGVDGLAHSKLIFEMHRGAVCSSADVFWGELDCLPTLTVLKNLNNNIINFNKPDVCTDLGTLQNCLSGVIKKYCENDYSPILDLVFSPFTDECNVLE